MLEKKRGRRFSSILIRLSFYIFSYFFHYSNWIRHAIKKVGASKVFKWKKRKLLCIHLPKELCPKELCHVGIGIKSSAAAGVRAAASSALFRSICRKNCVKASHPNHQRETYFVSNIWTLLRLCWRTSTWTFCVWGPLFQRLHHILIAPLGISNLSTQRYRLESFRGSPECSNKHVALLQFSKGLLGTIISEKPFISILGVRIIIKQQLVTP